MVISQSLQHYSHLLILDIINIVDKAYIGFQKYICTHLFISMEWHAGSWKSINYMLSGFKKYSIKKFKSLSNNLLDLVQCLLSARPYLPVYGQRGATIFGFKWEAKHGHCSKQ